MEHNNCANFLAREVLDSKDLIKTYGGIGDEISICWIHKTAIIDNAIIGKNTKIWHWTHISDGVSIGKNCIIGQSVFVGKGVKIGNGCKIQNNVFIPTGVELEDNVFIGPSVVFTNVINPRAFIERKDKFKSTLVMLGTSIGANATILCGISIGKYTMIGAGAVVTKNIGDFEVVLGNPAKFAGYIQSDGSTILPKDGPAIKYFEEKLMKKRKIKIRWTCSNYVHHEHRWKWTARLCGRIQKYLATRL